MTSRQSTHEANLRKTGWRRVGVWLSPFNVVQLRVMCERLGASEQEVMRRALNGLYVAERAQ